MYAASDNSVTVNAVASNLVSGTTYRFVLASSNSFGDSPLSQETRVSFASLPTKPNAPVKVESQSSTTAIAVGWDLSSDQ